MTTEQTTKNSVTLEEVQLRCEAAGRLDKKNQKSVLEMADRMKASRDEHKRHLANRTAYATSLDNQLNGQLKANEALASRFRYLAYNFYNIKINMLNRIQDKLNSFVGVKDKAEVKGLQERMHFALQTYFDLKGT